jgi:hypothetical protein
LIRLFFKKMLVNFCLCKILKIFVVMQALGKKMIKV